MVGETRDRIDRSDGELVRLCLAGDNSAYDELVGRHQKLLYNYCYRMLGNADDASDVVQEAFVNAYRALARFRIDASFGAWLHRIAHNLCVDKHRARGRAGHCSIDDACDAGCEPADDDMSPPELAQLSELGETLQKAIMELPPKYRSVVIMRHFQGMSIREISEALKIPEGTVKANLHRARSILRGKLSYLEATV